MKVTHTHKETGDEVNVHVDPIDGHAHITHEDGSVSRVTPSAIDADYDAVPDESKSATKGKKS